MTLFYWIQVWTFSFERLGLVNAKRFIFLVNKEPFDYTKWSQNLFEGMTVEEISAVAMRLREEEKLRKSNQ